MLQRDIVRSSAIKQPAMVALLDKLEVMGLIFRTPSESDRRAAMVKLTERGSEAALIGRDVLIATNRQGLEGFSEDEANSMITLFQRLIANFEK